MKIIKSSVMWGLLIITLLTIQPKVTADTTDNFLNGLNNYYRGNYKEAVTELERVLSEKEIESSLLIDSIYYQTLSYIELYSVEQAQSNIEKLRERGYQFGLLYWRLGTVFLNKKRKFDSPFYKEARIQLLRAKALGIDSPSFHRDLSLAYRGLGQYEEAIQQYKLSLTPESTAGNYLDLALLYQEVEQPENAISSYKKALDINSDKVSSYLNLGRIYLEQKQFQEAVKTLKQGVEINPSFEALRFELGRAYYLNEEFEQAKQQFEKVVENNKNNYRAYYFLGQISVNNNRIQTAVNYFNEAVKYNPDYADAYIALGDLFVKQEKYYQAISEYSTAIEKNKTYPKSHYHLALVYIKLDMKEAAVAELRRTIHLHSDHSEARKLLDELTDNEN